MNTGVVDRKPAKATDGMNAIRPLVVLAILISIIYPNVTADAAGPPQAGPKYQNLRYEEDFSYLGGPEGSYMTDPWDPIKWIALGEDWYLTVGGQARLRLESETDKDFGAISPSQDTFLLQRYFLHADLKHIDGLRFFVQGKSAHVTDRDRGGFPSLEDQSDIHQGFADIPWGVGARPLVIRLGRQELQYGAERLISPLDWGNIRRTFDGAKIFWDSADWRVDAFAVRPVIGDRRNLDDENENVDFYGLYSTWKGTSASSADFYFLLLDDDEPAANSNGNVGTRTLYTAGLRVWGKQGHWDWESEAAAQFGTFAGDRVRAGMAAAGAGYTFADATWTPRLGILYDYGSGDRDPTDGIHGTFNQHFPLGHAWLGYLDLVGRQNIHAIKAQLRVHPSRSLTAWADFHTFYADQDRDALYSAAGSKLRSAPAAGAGSNLFGHELDLTVRYILDVHATALIGWAHMWPGGFIQRTGPAEQPDLLYTQVEYKF